MLASDLFAEIHMAITSNKVRTGLTILGIVIGIASVIIMIAIGTGSQVAIKESIQSIGSNLLTVQPGQQQSFGGGARGNSSVKTLTMEDVEAIENNVENITAIAPVSSGNERIIANGNNTQSTVNGITEEYFTVNNVIIEDGSSLSESHQKSRSRVAVIGPDLKEDLFGLDSNVIGEKIRIGSSDFTIIGITESKGGTGFSSSDDTVFIPLSTYQQYFLGDDYLSSINVSISEQEFMTAAEEDITETLLASHGIADVADADFNIRNQADIIEMTSSITGTMTILLGAVAGISLVVGGIGIMNMMLTTVTERTREIGLRKSIGANQKDISQQFLLESIVLTFIGGIVGIILGVTISIVLNNTGIVATQISTSSISLSFGVSAIIGIVFGYYPARRASKLNPIDALRYE